MDPCPRCFVLCLILVRLSVVYPVAPLMLDYSHLLDADAREIFDASHLAYMPETPDRMKFDQHVTLSEDGNVKLSWNFTDESITFKLSAQTPGWIGFGISRNRLDNKGADFAVMGYTDEHTYLVDMHIDKDGMYIIDEMQNIMDNYIWGTEEETFAIFSRPLITCDHDDDVEITGDTLRVIWAFGAVDIQGFEPKKGELFAAKSGSLEVKLLNPTIPPLEVDETDTDIETLEITMKNVRVEVGEYRHCTAFQFPEISSQRHIIQFEPILTAGNKHSVRQITVRECNGTYQGLVSSHQAEYDCDSDAALSKCNTIVINWAIGMSNFTFPKETGYLIGESGKYFIMVIRYENPQNTGLLDSSGMRIYHTSNIRDNDAGVLTTGSLVHESQIIPPRSPNFRLQGHCMKKCVQLALEDQPQQNITIFAALLHTRELGRKIRVRHFRDGEELSPVAEDNRFYHLHQETQFLKHDVHLKKGDNMIVECTYDTFDRNEITYVNNSKGGESCLAYLSYYPKIAQLTACETAPTENVIMATVGAVRPEEMKKSAEKFEWTTQQTQEYNNKVLASQVYVHCGSGPLKDPQPVPKIKNVFVEKHKCKRLAPERVRQNDTDDTNDNDDTDDDTNDTDDDGNGAASILWSKSSMFFLSVLSSSVSFYLNSPST